MPAHDTPYFEPAGGQNAEAFSVAKAVSMGPIAGDSLTGGMPPRAGHRWRVVARRPGAPARCLAAGSGAARPLLVGAPCPSRCPRRGSGRDARPGPAPDDRPAPAAVAPGHRRSEGRDSPGRPAPPRPGPPDVGVGRAAVTCAVTAISGPGRRSGTGGPLRGTGRGPVAIWREGSPSGLGPVRFPLMPDRAVTVAGLSGARFPRLPRGPRSDGPPRAPRSCRRSLAGVARWAASAPL